MGHDLNAAMIFVRVAETGSLRAAARQLGVPKSTVSRRLATLEESLGARLLQRTTRGLNLTDVGRAYFEQAGAAVRALLEAERMVADQQREPRGLLRVSASVNFGMLVLPPLMNEFLTLYPHVQVSLDLSDRFVDLVQEGFDLAIRAGSLPDSTLIAHRLGSSALTVYASPKYLRKRGTPQTPKDLEGHDCLLFSPGQVQQWGFQVEGRKVEVRLNARMTANNMLALREAAIAGLGLTRLPSFVAASAIERRQLVPLLEKYSAPPTPVQIVYPSSRFLSPRVRAFIELASERFPVVAQPRKGRAR